MGAKNTSKYSSKIQIGDVFGSWVVSGEVFVDRYAKVRCRCKCGKESNVDAYTLFIGKTKSCITCFNSGKDGKNNSSWKGHNQIPASWFTRFRNYAKKKNNSFEITLQDVWELFISQNKKCALSGLPIDFKRVGINNQASYTASIDRIDSKKGYIIDNIQLVHKDVNIMKNAFNQDYFISVCKLVINHNIKSSND